MWGKLQTKFQIILEFNMTRTPSATARLLLQHRRARTARYQTAPRRGNNSIRGGGMQAAGQETHVSHLHNVTIIQWTTIMSQLFNGRQYHKRRDAQCHAHHFAQAIDNVLDLKRRGLRCVWKTVVVGFVCVSCMVGYLD